MELFRSAAKSLFLKRSQLFLTVCGIAIGVFSVLTISTIGQAGQTVINGELEKLGFDCVTVSASQKELNTLSGGDLPAVNALEEVALAAPLSTAMGRAGMRCGPKRLAYDSAGAEERPLPSGKRCCRWGKRLHRR